MRPDLKKRRLYLGISQAAVAKEIGVSDQTISNIERGKNKVRAATVLFYEKLLEEKEKMFRGPQLLPTINKDFDQEVLQAEIQEETQEKTQEKTQERSQETQPVYDYQDPADPTVFPVAMFGTTVDCMCIKGVLYVKEDDIPQDKLSDKSLDASDCYYVNDCRFIRYDTTHAVVQKQSCQWKKIRMQGTDIRAFEREDTIWVGLSEVCTALGIQDIQSQIKKITENPSFAGRFSYAKSALATDRDVRPRFYITAAALTRWMATVHPNKVLPEHRSTLIYYQWEAEKVLHEHFFPKKEALNNRTDVTGKLERLEHKMEHLAEQLNDYIEQQRVLHLQQASLPDSFDMPLERNESIRQAINRAIPILASKRGIDIRWAYNELYAEFRSRYKIDLKKRAAARKCSVLEVLEKDRLIDRAYAVLRSLLADNTKNR